MWFISRCISIDALNSCLQQQKNKLSYDFCLCREKSDVSSARNDEDDCEPLARKSSRNNLNHHHQHHRHYQHIRRRIPKRYSNIIGSFGTKRKDSVNVPLTQNNHSLNNIPLRHSIKSQNEKTNCFNLHKKKSHEIKYYHNKHEDILAHRMQAAMSSELMHSLDRNFVFGKCKQSITNSPMIRSYSLNICTCWKNEKADENSCTLNRTNAKVDFDNEILSIELPTPDYDEINDDIIIKPIQNDLITSEEPAIDYDDSKPTIICESDDRSSKQTNLEILSSCVSPLISTEKGEDETSTPLQSPPPPPPLPNLIIEQKDITFQCHTIVEEISSEQGDEIKSSETLKTPSPILRKPLDLNLSKRSKYGKISQSLSCSNLSDVSIVQISNHETNSTMYYKNPSVTDEKILDRLSLSSPGTSIEIDHEHRSSSSKIYNDYKRQTSITSVLTNTIPSHSLVIQPMHPHFGLRSITSSGSTNEKLADMTLSSKQINVCVINQLNEHLSARFRRQQQQELCSNNNINNNLNVTATNNLSYDSSQTYMSRNNNTQSNIYDEPKDLPGTNTIFSSTISPQIPSPPLPPPPPPPLPAGGFPPIIQSINRSSASQRTSTMTVARESINSNIPCSTIGSTISSNLSDTRILRELRENPLFARAKEQLEIAPGSNGRRSGRRLIGSTSNLVNTESLTNETLAYVRFDNSTKINDIKKSNEIPTSQQIETIVIDSKELNAILGSQSKAINQMNLVKSRPCIKSSMKTLCRQSELELIFKKRAQRSEQNLM